MRSSSATRVRKTLCSLGSRLEVSLAERLADLIESFEGKGLALEAWTSHFTGMT